MVCYISGDLVARMFLSCLKFLQYLGLFEGFWGLPFPDKSFDRLVHFITGTVLTVKGNDLLRWTYACLNYMPNNKMNLEEKIPAFMVFTNAGNP